MIHYVVLLHGSSGELRLAVVRSQGLLQREPRDSRTETVYCSFHNIDHAYDLVDKLNAGFDATR